MKLQQDMAPTAPPVPAGDRIPYTAPQPSGLMTVREYRFVASGDQRCLLIRWVKEADFSVDSFTFELTLLDAVGGCTGNRRITYRASDLPAAEVGVPFTMDSGIPVDEDCAGIHIRLLEVVSGSYIYRVQADRTVTVDYEAEEPWAYDGHAGEAEGLSDTITLRVVSKKAKPVRFLWLVALAALLLLMWAYVRPYL